MPSGFVHSVKVPRLYKSAAKVVREVREKGGSLKSLIYEQKHPNVSALNALCFKTLEKEESLDHIINKTNLLVNESRLDPWLAKILITELLWGKKVLNSECKPAQTILGYEQKLKEELSSISDVQALQAPKPVKRPRYVRINTLSVPLKKGISYFQEEGWSLLPKCSNYTEHLSTVKSLKEPNFIQDFHTPELLVFPSNTTFHDHPGYQNGEIILQDKASCLPSQLLNPTPGSLVLDMCAAPGMKSSHLAALMKNTGTIYAVEIDQQRYKTLCDQVRVTISTCIETINKDALTLEANKYPNVEYILVDPTCSGSGMLDRQIIYGKEKFDPQRLKQLQAFQVFLLRHALLNFPNVKRVVYSTCSINPEENEEVVDEILENVQDAYKLVHVKKLLNNEWLNFSSKKYKCSDMCLYAKPDIDLCNGFFVAVFERNFDVPLPEYKRKINVALNESEYMETEDSKVEKASETRKRKKRGKRKSSTTQQIPKKQITSTNEETTADNVLSISSDSIKIIEEINKDNSSKNNDASVTNDTDEPSDNDDGEPVVKRKKKKIIHKIMKKLPRKGPIVKEVKLQKKKKRKTL